MRTPEIESGERRVVLERLGEVLCSSRPDLVGCAPHRATRKCQYPDDQPIRVLHFEGEQGAERLVRVEQPDGQVLHCKGEQGAERLVRVEHPDAAAPAAPAPAAVVARRPGRSSSAKRVRERMAVFGKRHLRESI
jgi:hypothetical protein